jgi:hypothetical protein
MVRVYVFSAWQNSSGLSPGTSSLPSKTFWSPPKRDRDFDAAKENRNSDERVIAIFISVLVFVLARRVVMVMQMAKSDPTVVS